MIPKRKTQLIQQFLELYQYYWKTNCGIDILALQQLPESQIMERIVDYQKLIRLRRI